MEYGHWNEACVTAVCWAYCSNCYTPCCFVLLSIYCSPWPSVRGAVNAGVRLFLFMHAVISVRDAQLPRVE